MDLKKNDLEKKEYIAPEMVVVELKFEPNLLSCSGDCDDEGDFKESSDWFD